MFNCVPARGAWMGIDLNTPFLRGLSLRQKKSSLHVQDCIFSALPNEASLAFAFQRHQLAISLEAWQKRHKMNSLPVTLALPDSKVHTKIVQCLATISFFELKEWLKMEAEKYFSYTAKEMSLDYQMLGPSPNQPNLMDVLLVVTKAYRVHALAKVVNDAGFKPKAIGLESLAIERAVSYLLAKETHKQKSPVAYVFVDVGNTFLKCFGFVDRRVKYVVEQPCNQKTLPCLSEMISNFCQEFIPLRVNRIFLAGVYSSLHSLALVIEEKTSMLTTVANPFLKMSFAPHLDPKIQEIGPYFMLAFGLALS